MKPGSTACWKCAARFLSAAVSEVTPDAVIYLFLLLAQGLVPPSIHPSIIPARDVTGRGQRTGCLGRGRKRALRLHPAGSSASPSDPSWITACLPPGLSRALSRPSGCSCSWHRSLSVREAARKASLVQLEKYFPLSHTIACCAIKMLPHPTQSALCLLGLLSHSQTCVLTALEAANLSFYFLFLISLLI